MEDKIVFVAWVLGAYLIGGIPFGHLIGKMRGVDVRTVGSKNIGATNVFRTVGKKWGLLAFLCDVMKGLLPVMITKYFVHNSSFFTLHSSLPLFVGIACVAGHMLTPYITDEKGRRFHGGKGVATAFGMLLGLIPALVGIAFGIFFIVLSLYFMFVQKNLKLPDNPIVGAVCGLISGTLSGLFSIGAPTMALYFRAVTEDRNHYFGNFQTLLAVANTVSTIARIKRGLYPADLILPSVVGFLGLLVGQFIGSKAGKNLDAEKLNKFIYIMVLLSGINTLVKYIR